MPDPTPLPTDFPPLPAGSDRLGVRALWNQFRTRYPTGGLTADLVHSREGEYVVRAAIQVDGVVLATGLAAGDRPELAEDRARVRALEVIGIYPSLPLSELAASPAPVTPLPSVPPPLPFPSPSRPIAPLQPVETGTARPLSNGVAAAAEAPTVTELPKPKPVPKPEREPVATSNAAAPPTVAIASIPSIDLSDAIAQTDVEIRRLGWTAKQGQEYLQTTYGKKSRQQLTDDELLDFLYYLQSLP